MNFSELKGKTLVDIEGLEEESYEVIFTDSEGFKYRMYHDQDCCEHVRIIDVIGDYRDLLFSEILFAAESSSDSIRQNSGDYGTWTFYKIATRKGWVDIRWLGESNGYYSETVNFIKL